MKERERLILFVLVFSFCLSSLAQETNVADTISPKLRKFCSRNSAAWDVFTNTLSEVSSNRSVSLLYFYSDDTKPRAFHYYPQTIGQSEVVICVRENQNPLDEFISLVFELLNSRSEDRFASVCEQAKLGSISREDFAKEILRGEFEAVKAMRQLLGRMKFTNKEATQSHYYQRFIRCPSDFEDFLAYSKKLSGERDPIKEYEAQYDKLRKLAEAN